MPTTDYNTSAASNTVLGTIPVGPGMERNKVNDAIQQLMADTASDVVLLASGTGAVSRTPRAKLREFVSVKDFGAVGNGSTDDTAAIQAAVDSLTAGGTLYFPPGRYRLTDEIDIPSVGGLVFQGSGGNDSVFGSPVPSGNGTFIFQETNSKAVFVIGGGCSYMAFRDMTLSASNSPGANPVGTDRYGVKITGTLPNVIWSLSFENIIFFNFERGVSCVDTASGTTSQDMSVAPVSFEQCFFTYCNNGIYIDTNNADFWTFESCFFFIPSGGKGANLTRFGLLFFNQCSAGGTAVSNNRFINVNATTLNSIDKIILRGVQTENLTNFITVQTGGGYSNPFVIEMESCVAELTSDIYLGSPCHLITHKCRFDGANIYVDNASVRLTTRSDQFSSGDFQFLSGSADACFYHTEWGPNPSALYSARRHENGVFVENSGSTTGVANLTPTTLFALTTTAGLYEVFAYIPNAGAGTLYMNSSRLGADGGTLARIGGEAGAGMSLTVSGTNVQAEQNSGSPQTINWRWRRIA